MGAILAKLALSLFNTALGPLVDIYKAKLAAGTSADTLASGLAARELGVQERETEVQAQVRVAEIGHWTEPDHLIGYVIVIYLAKVYLWDAAFHLGTTDSVGGQAGSALPLVLICYFGKRGFENVSRIIRSMWK